MLMGSDGDAEGGVSNGRESPGIRGSCKCYFLPSGMEEGELLPLLLLIGQCFLNFSSLPAIFSIFADFLCQIM